mgnify:CR=1 FL=1
MRYFLSTFTGNTSIKMASLYVYVSPVYHLSIEYYIYEVHPKLMEFLGILKKKFVFEIFDFDIRF